MPQRPPRLSHPRIKQAVIKPDTRRGTACQRGYNRQWRKARLEYIADYPLCAECLKAGKYVAAAVVDHITPHRGDNAMFWDSGNWQSLCKPCHDKKTGSGK